MREQGIKTHSDKKEVRKRQFISTLGPWQKIMNTGDTEKFSMISPGSLLVLMVLLHSLSGICAPATEFSSCRVGSVFTIFMLK